MRRRLRWSLGASLGAILCGLTPAIAAGQLSYNYLEAGYLKLAPDSAMAPRGKGYVASVSAPLEPGSFLLVRYARSEPEAGGDTASILSSGLGYYAPWQAGMDLYGLLSYEKHRLVGSGERVSGYGGEIGLRWLLGNLVELNGGGAYLKLSRQPDSTNWFGGFVVHMTPGMALTGRYENTADHHRYSLGLRLLPR